MSKLPIPAQSNFIKIQHGILIFSLVIAIGSGLQIYNANPVFGGREGWNFPNWLTLGGWLAGGRDIHFAIAWVYAFNLLIYGIYILITRRWRHKFASRQDLKALTATRNPKRRYYAIHRIVYTSIIPILLLSIASGLAMYKPAQFSWLAALFGDWQTLRTVHFITVPISLLFMLVHMGMGLLAGGFRLTRSMFQP
jgi:thiosulfate reductase cytochrome b subunit